MTHGRSGSISFAPAAPDLSGLLAVSNLLSSVPGVLHGVTSRVVGLGIADGNVGYGAPRDRADAWAMRHAWCRAIGINPERLITAHQVHGSSVSLVSADQAGQGAMPGSTPVAAADALITRDAGVALMTLHADCQPILIVDRENPAIASVHAGWRGTVQDVAGATIAAMETAFETRPDGVVAFLSPSIGACCYEVGNEVVEAWREQARDDADRALRAGPRRLHLDIKAANRFLLERAGVPDENIEASDVCTRCQGREWFSHRGQGPHTGRFGAIIALVEASTSD
ncbi:MAG: peptidoglycan editing factor PgeF [Thermomicrobiales bacterium]